MPRYSRRAFVRLSGTAIGGFAAGTTVVGAESPGRYVVDTRGVGRGRLRASSVEVVHDLNPVDVAVVRGPESAVRDLGTAYAPDVEMELDLPVEPRATEPSAQDEPLYEFQWDKQDQNIPEAHEVTKGDGARVTIIDTGVAAGHPDINTVNAALSRNFTDDGLGAPGPYAHTHGTHVAGIVGADDDNEEGVVGSAPDAELVDCRVFPVDQPFAAFGDILAAMVYSAQIGADAANLSLGAYPVPRPELRRFYGRVLNRIMTYVNARGTLLVVAAGNDSADLQHDKYLIALPAEGAQGFTVSATGPIGYRWGEEGLREPFHAPAVYTNYGTNAVDVAAPGGNADLDAVDTGVPWYYDLVLNTVATYDEGDTPGEDTPTYGYDWHGGTSMAAPQVAGAVALVASVTDYLRRAQANRIENVIQRTAEVPPDYAKVYYGSGYLNTADAVYAAARR